MVLNDLNKFYKFFKYYTELRFQENKTTQVVLLNGNITQNHIVKAGGVSARVYRNGSWGFCSNSDFTSQTIKFVIQTASFNAGFLSPKERRTQFQNARGRELTSACIIHEDSKFGGKSQIERNQMVDFLREIDNHIATTYPKIIKRVISLNDFESEKVLLTSDGSKVSSYLPRTILKILLSIEKNGRRVDLSTTNGGLGHFEEWFQQPNDINEKIADQYQRLVQKSEGISVDAGVKTCILDAELVGTLAHEAIGHTTEADLVLSGSAVGKQLGQEISSPLITLIDYANHAFGAVCPVPIYADDEGTKARDVTIIRNGVLENFMHNRESALLFMVEPTGNARASSYLDEPLIRMRNTAIQPGNDTLNDMISSINDGYYLIQPSNGQADSTGEFMFGVTLGYQIKNGRLGRAIFDTTVSGSAFKVLKTVSMVSHDFKWASAGMCSKKQIIPVGLGGPAIKCQINIGGK